MVAGSAWLGLLLRMLQQLFFYILWGCSGVWRLQPGLEAHIHTTNVILGLQSHRIEAGPDMGTPSDTRTSVVAWQKWS